MTADRRRYSPKEVEQQHLQAMGDAVGPIYHALWKDVVLLHYKWQQYRALFATSSEDLRLLNSVAGFFFQIIEGVIGDDVLLHLARLVDPATSLGRVDKANVTVRVLPSLILDAAFASKVTDLVNDAQTRCAFAVDARNRRIAHRDRALALNHPAAKPLAPVTRGDIEAALTSIRAVLCAVHGHYLHMDPGFERFVAPPGAEALLYYLRRGLGQGESL